MADWEITIDGFDGLVPAFWENEFPSFGNKGHAASLNHIDLTDPSVLKPGPGLATLTNGGSVTTLIKGLQQLTPDGVNVYGVGGSQLYKLISGQVVFDATWPHTIDKAAVTGEDGEDVAYYKSNTYYSYNHSGSAGDVGQFNGSAFDDDYMSTVPSGAAALTGGVPHPMCVGGDDVLYIGNGRYVAKLSGTTFTAQALDLPVGEVITDIAWENNRLYITTNKPSVAGVFNQASVYVWDTTATSWEYQISVQGRLGACHAKNGVVYVFYHDLSSTGGYKLAIVSNGGLQDVAAFTSGIPAFNQVTEHKNHILFVAGDDIWAFGASAPNLPTKLFQLASTGYASPGGLSNAFGTPMIASSNGSSYRVAQFSGYETDAQFKSLLLNVASAQKKSVLDRVTILTEPLASGAALDLTLKSDYGAGSKALAQIAYATAPNGVKHVVLQDSIALNNLRLDFDWTNGSAANPVKVRQIMLSGSYVDDN